MTLEMRRVCERCGAALTSSGEAYICTYECTFCPACSWRGTDCASSRTTASPTLPQWTYW